jgi:hypothetical protein
MPPLVPASMKPIPSSCSAAARRTLSRQLELPPSITTSPGSSSSPRRVTVPSVGSPAGTITHTTRGASSAATSSSSDATWVSALKAS